ncbi:acetyl xylan esterase [Plantibacter sp. Leaf171]|uniref:acetylxylan esterase n=1 Tax=unclassified Plantibacter TaxID=2624265 RepID=UPI0006F2D487|nr:MULTISPECIES: acetylxylan esterase [unclassified Plantibacter]KQM16668.1 acetyl xylan esterase [Plantibacter sp. Leaf1]KQR59804.1 acetyl xylan esterase [Plantibacter sp. Leaf171]
MAQFDLPIAQLQQYLPDREEAADFDAFWADTIAEAHALAQPTERERSNPELTGLIVEDVTFSGFGGDPIKGWFIRPAGASGPLPCVVHYIGYSGGRGFAHQWTMHPSAGYAVFVMDTRGQGSANRPGATADPVGSGPQVAGKMSAGLDSRETYYYRRVFTDAALAVDVVRSFPEVDPARVVVAGVSQGGGIALAAAGLSEGLAGALVDVPFLSHYRRALQITDASPFAELKTFLISRRGQEEQVFRTLSYFDATNFAARATAPTLFSVALCDAVCPPSTVYAAFNHYAGAQKDIAVYPYNGHEGGGPVQEQRQLEVLADLFA